MDKLFRLQFIILLSEDDMYRTAAFGAMALALVMTTAAADARDNRNQHRANTTRYSATHKGTTYRAPAAQRQSAVRAYQKGVQDGQRRSVARTDRNAVERAYRQGVTDGQRTGTRYASPVYRTSAVGYNTGYNTYDDRYWWGNNGQIRCRRSDGTTGTIVGAVAGGALGNVIAREGDKTVGTAIGGVLGALLGHEIDNGGARCR